MKKKTEKQFLKLLDDIYMQCYGEYTATERKIRAMIDKFFDPQEN